MTINVIGKRNKERTLYIHGGALRAMDAWLEVRDGNDGAVFCPIDKGGNIHVDRQMRTTALDYILKKRLLQAAIAGIEGELKCRERLGGLLRHYYRDAA